MAYVKTADDILQTRCPRCGAEPGEACKAKDGGPRDLWVELRQPFHFSRSHAALPREHPEIER